MGSKAGTRALSVLVPCALAGNTGLETERNYQCAYLDWRQTHDSNPSTGAVLCSFCPPPYSRGNLPSMGAYSGYTYHPRRLLAGLTANLDIWSLANPVIKPTKRLSSYHADTAIVRQCSIIESDVSSETTAMVSHCLGCVGYRPRWYNMWVYLCWAELCYLPEGDRIEDFLNSLQALYLNSRLFRSSWRNSPRTPRTCFYTG